MGQRTDGRPPGEEPGEQPGRSTSVTDASTLAEALTELRTRAGLSIRAVSRTTGIPSATLGGWFSGRHLPPASQKAQFESVLLAVGVPASELAAWWADLGRVRRVPGHRVGDRVAPYRGLESYGVDDAEWFFAREDLVDALSATVVELLQVRPGSAETGDPSVVSVVGASGSGKSSLVRAGLAARLRARGIRVVVTAPGGAPEAALREAEQQLGEADGPRLLVVDQLEELFGDRVAPEALGRFVRSLVAFAAAPATVVVVALRADFYGAAVAEAEMLPLLRSHQQLVGPLDGASLRRVVVEPAERAGLSVEPELVDLALRDVYGPRTGAPDASSLPLLSHAMLATWSRAHRGRLTVSDYVAAGGVAGAVQRSAEQVYGSLDDAARATARRLFSQLVSVDDEGIVTRRRVHHADLAEDEELAPVVEAFVAGRILTATESTLEISHEVLLGAWPRLAAWVEADRDVLRLRRRVAQAAADWDTHGRERDGLLRGGLLAQLQDAGRGMAIGLNGVERAFLAASVRDAERRRRAAQGRGRRMRSMFAVVAVLAVVATLLSAYLVRALDDAEEHRTSAVRERNRAVSRQVAIQAVQLREREPAVAAQLAVAAHRVAPTVEARSALLEGTNLAPVTRVLAGPDGPVRAVATGDGSLLATATSDGTVRLWRPGTSVTEPVATVAAHDRGELYAAALSADGTLLAVGGAAGVVTLIDLTDPDQPVRRAPLAASGTVHDLAIGRGQLFAATSAPSLDRWAVEGAAPRSLPAPDGLDFAVHAVALGPGGLVATGSADGAVRLWRQGPPEADDELTPARTIRVGGPTTVVRSVAFDPDGRVVAAGLTDATVRVWDVPTGRAVTPPLTGATSWVNAVAFSPDGASLAGVASGGQAQVWATDTWESSWSAPGPANYTSVQFVDSGRRLLTGAIDGDARLVTLQGGRLPPLGDNIWGVARPANADRMYVGVGTRDPMVAVVDVTDPLRPRLVRALRGPNGGPTINGVVGVTPDGRLLVAGTSTGELVAWQVDGSGAVELLGAVPAARELIENISFSQDGSRFAVSSDDGSVTVFDVASAGLPEQVAQVDATPLALGVALDRDGTLLAVGGSDEQVRLFDVEGADTAQPVAVLSGHESYVYAAAFSPSGTLLATGSADTTVRLWDVSDPASPELVGAPLQGPTDTVFAATFDVDGRRLAAASQDGRVWLWRLEGPTRTPRATLEARLGTLEAGLFAVSLSGDGTVSAGGAGGVVGTWAVDEEVARERACATSGAPITAEEWRRYAPGVGYDPPCG